MRKFVASVALATAFVLGGFFGVLPAKANTFDFTISGGGFTGSGTFIDGLIGPGPGGSTKYQITGITGNLNGDSITGISNFASADNVLYYPASTVAPNGAGQNTPPTFVDLNGISFVTQSLMTWNIFNYLVFETGTAITNADACCGTVISFNVSAISAAINLVDAAQRLPRSGLLCLP